MKKVKRHVRNKDLAKKITAGLAISLMSGLMLLPTALAENRTYTGDWADLRVIEGDNRSFGPASSTSSNTITINYTPNALNRVNSVFGGYDSAQDSDSTNNCVNLIEGTANQVFGGFSGKGGTIDNSFIISGGTVQGNVFGGFSSGNATDNSVTINGGTVQGNVYGGYSEKGKATGNSITINGGTVSSEICGGISYNGNAIGNTVTISGTPILTSALLSGGSSYGSGDFFTGNTLNVKNCGMVAQGVQNFQHYNFYLPTTLANGGTMLTVVSPANISNSIIGVGIDGTTTALHPGDRVTLLSSAGGLTVTGINTRAQELAGIAKIYDFDLTTDANNLYATAVDSSGPNPQVKALSEGQVASATFINQSVDLAAGKGMENARTTAAEGGGQPSAFSAMGFNSLRYETGSHVDVRGFSLIAGAAREKAAANGNIMNGLFLEVGWGNYSTYNDFASAPSVRGDGDTHYLGAGWLGRWQKNSGQYMEGSVRAGRITNKFSSNDFAASGGLTHSGSYDVSTPYYGMHIGFGNEKALGNNCKLDIYTKLMWTHQNVSNATVQGDVFDFGTVNSYRGQLGTKWLRKTDERTTLRSGIAYQYEFGGKADARVNGSAVDAPSIRGGSSIVELGMNKKGDSADKANWDFGLQGFFGKVRGFAGNIQVAWKY